jgi:hypothetical protein
MCPLPGPAVSHRSFQCRILRRAAVGAAGVAVADLMAAAFGSQPCVVVNRRLASLWFGVSIRPIEWVLPASRDPIAGDYATADGWIRLHTNAPHHRAAALSVLGVAAEKQAVAVAVAHWKAEELETAIVGNRGCAAAMRSLSEWKTHPQGEAVIREHLIDARATADSGDPLNLSLPTRPLQGVRVLDLTRVLAGPVATRFLAGLGADVLRIDPPSWEEPGVVPDVALGKRCARLDLRDAQGRTAFLDLLRRTDVLVHGYRPGALDNLGLDARSRREIRPGLIDISLDAYGWTGPWRHRRGFDSLVQMSAARHRNWVARLRPGSTVAVRARGGWRLCGGHLGTWNARSWPGGVRAASGDRQRILPQADPDESPLSGNPIVQTRHRIPKVFWRLD